MPRDDRLFDILQILRDGRRHRAEDLARRLNVSVRTIYRDMERLMASGAPVAGERGRGYIATGVTLVPPLSLSPEELEALNLGIAIVAEAPDPGLKAAAASLADKIDAALAEQTRPEDERRRHAPSPFADAARGFSHMSTIRAAIRARQKLKIDYRAPDGERSRHKLRPLKLDYWGRIWTLLAWCEDANAFRAFRTDLVETAETLPELFVDEPGKRLSDYLAESA